MNDDITWRRAVESYGHIARRSATDGRPQVLRVGTLAYKTFNSEKEAIDYAKT